ncbi:MAG TPA: four helix bundle protein [Ferruginibacter sp.]|nr:four helix bundle protein [Ferruginibacter sp.]
MKEDGLILFKSTYLMERKYDLDERLINFADMIIDISEVLPKTFAGNHIAGQLVRSGTAPALQYGEAQSAESRNDFIHKMKISAKELRETYNCIRLIRKRKWHAEDKILKVLDENNQLISIFVKSIETAKKNNTPKKDKSL